MQLFKLITGKPVLFSDVRHYDDADNVWYFSNSGTHATWFACASDDPAINLKDVFFFPETSYYPAGGASVHHFAAEGKVTLARLARKNGKYWMAIVPAEFIRFPLEVMVAKGRTITQEWPCAFARLDCGADDFLMNFPCNHIHGTYGNWERELLHVAELLGIEAKVFRS
jgi:L-fucose isomerase